MEAAGVQLQLMIRAMQYLRRTTIGAILAGEIGKLHGQALGAPQAEGTRGMQTLEMRYSLTVTRGYWPRVPERYR
jgi:hypothetical protein